jgi:hypothetical protein
MHGDDGGTLSVAAPGAEREFRVEYLTRVEGEGTLQLRVRGTEVVEARLRIFEAPRYFERLVVGRTGDEVIDIVARICGICPIAYQMSAVHGFEDLYGSRSIRPCGRFGDSCTAGSGSRATRCTCTCSTRRTSWAIRPRSRWRPTIGRSSSRGWRSSGSATS